MGKEREKCKIARMPKEDGDQIIESFTSGLERVKVCIISSCFDLGRVTSNHHTLLCRGEGGGVVVVWGEYICGWMFKEADVCRE